MVRKKKERAETRSLFFLADITAGTQDPPFE